MHLVNYAPILFLVIFFRFSVKPE